MEATGQNINDSSSMISVVEHGVEFGVGSGKLVWYSMASVALALLLTSESATELDVAANLTTCCCQGTEGIYWQSTHRRKGSGKVEHGPAFLFRLFCRLTGFPHVNSIDFFFGL